LGFEAVVDVGIVVIAYFRNPDRKYAAQLLLEALTLKKRVFNPSDLLPALKGARSRIGVPIIGR